MLGRRPALAAGGRQPTNDAGRIAIERAIDGIAIGATLARSLGLDPLVAAEAAALRDLALESPASAAQPSPAATSRHWQHPIVAADRILAAGGSYLVASAVAAHHERLDGSGHPDGLAGDDLGPVERLVALVDVLVAMTHRDAAGGLPIGEAFRALRMAIAGRFDGRTVLALAGLIADGTLGAGRPDRPAVRRLS
jgi:hypothetical protein